MQPLVVPPLPPRSSCPPPPCPPLDEDWQLEWRWGAAHPWLRPSHAPAASRISDASSANSFSSPLPPSATFPPPPSPPPPSSNIASSSSCAPQRSSSASPPLPLPSSVRASPDPRAAATSAVPNTEFSPFVWDDGRAPQVYKVFSRHQNCPLPVHTSSSSSAASTTLPQPVLSISSRFVNRGLPQEKHPEPASAALLTAAAARRPLVPAAAAAGATAAPSAAAEEGREAERKVAAEARPAFTERLAALLTAAAGAPRGSLETVRTPQLEAARAALSSSESSSAGRSAAARRAADEAKFVGERDEVREVEPRKSGGEKGGIEHEAAAASVVASRFAQASASAVDADVAAAHAEAADAGTVMHESRGTARERQQMLPQPLLQFGDRTLSYLQRQQMLLWSFFAFRDWRVKTLVHALSAMGEPVNLVVVDCMPPAAASPAASPSFSHPSSVSGAAASPASAKTPSAPPALFRAFPASSWTQYFDLLLRVASSAVSQAATQPPPSMFAASFLSPVPQSLASPSATAPTGSPSVAASRFAAALLPSSPLAASEPPSLLFSATAVAAEKPGERAAPRLCTGGDAAAVKSEATTWLASTSPPFADENVVRGGYSPLYHTVWLCGNRLWSPFELRRVLLHELVHAFDFARANLSPDNCRHVACTELRAYNLSGQCGWWRTRAYDAEQFNTLAPLPSVPLPLRGAAKAAASASPRGEQKKQLLQQQQQQQEADKAGELQHVHDSGRQEQWQPTKRNRCLTHGALNSLRQHRRCQAPGVAEEAVREVFTRCVHDTWPFLAPPERDSKWRPSRMWRSEAADFFKK